MMPCVARVPSPRALPMATTQSPTLILDESPTCAAGRLVASIFSTAKSVSGSVATVFKSTGKVRPSSRVTEIVLAPSMTWLLVMITPSCRIIQPEPAPFWELGRLKKSKNVTSVLIATTDGFTFATTSAMLGRAGDCVEATGTGFGVAGFVVAGVTGGLG